MQYRFVKFCATRNRIWFILLAEKNWHWTSWKITAMKPNSKKPNRFSCRFTFTGFSLSLSGNERDWNSFWRKEEKIMHRRTRKNGKLSFLSGSIAQATMNESECVSRVFSMHLCTVYTHSFYNRAAFAKYILYIVSVSHVRYLYINEILFLSFLIFPISSFFTCTLTRTIGTWLHSKYILAGISIQFQWVNTGLQLSEKWAFCEFICEILSILVSIQS